MVLSAGLARLCGVRMEVWCTETYRVRAILNRKAFLQQRRLLGSMSGVSFVVHHYPKRAGSLVGRWLVCILWVSFIKLHFLVHLGLLRGAAISSFRACTHEYCVLLCSSFTL